MKINKILQERAFRQKTITDGGQILTSAERSMYYAILQIVDDKACGNNWADYLPISVRQLMREAALSSKTVITARKRLIELGLITVKPPKNSRASMEYRIVKLYDEKPTTQNQPTQAAEDAEAQKYIAKLDNAARAYFEKLQDATDLSDLQTAQYLAVLGTDKCKNILKWVLKKGDAVDNVGNYFKWKANEVIKKAQHTQALLASIPQQQQEQLDSWLN